MAYKGIYKVKNKKKYKGDPNKVVFRSLWERNVFRWVDANPDILEWSSEEIIIPYRCSTDRKIHRYFPDLYLVTVNGQYIIEIKPEKETKEPRKRTRKSAKYLKEVMTYMKNQSKWTAAKEFCEDRGITFTIWTEKTIKKMGIKLLT